MEIGGSSLGERSGAVLIGVVSVSRGSGAALRFVWGFAVNAPRRARFSVWGELTALRAVKRDITDGTG